MAISNNYQSLIKVIDTQICQGTQKLSFLANTNRIIDQQMQVGDCLWPGSCMIPCWPSEHGLLWQVGEMPVLQTPSPMVHETTCSVS